MEIAKNNLKHISTLAPFGPAPLGNWSAYKSFNFNFRCSINDVGKTDRAEFKTGRDAKIVNGPGQRRDGPRNFGPCRALMCTEYLHCLVNLI